MLLLPGRARGHIAHSEEFDLPFANWSLDQQCGRGCRWQFQNVERLAALQWWWCLVPAAFSNSCPSPRPCLDVVRSNSDQRELRRKRSHVYYKPSRVLNNPHHLLAITPLANARWLARGLLRLLYYLLLLDCFHSGGGWRNIVSCFRWHHWSWFPTRIVAPWISRTRGTASIVSRISSRGTS